MLSVVSYISQHMIPIFVWTLNPKFQHHTRPNTLDLTDVPLAHACCTWHTHPCACCTSHHMHAARGIHIYVYATWTQKKSILPRRCGGPPFPRLSGSMHIKASMLGPALPVCPPPALPAHTTPTFDLTNCPPSPGVVRWRSHLHPHPPFFIVRDSSSWAPRSTAAPCPWHSCPPHPLSVPLHPSS